MNQFGVGQRSITAMKSYPRYVNTVLGALLFFGAIVLIVFMTFQTQREYQSILMGQAQEQLLATAKSTARSLEEFFTMQRNVLKSLSTDPLLVDMDSNADYAQLEMRYNELEGDIGGFYIISPKGIVTHRFPNKDRVGKDFSRKPGVSAVLKSQKPYVSRLFFSDSGKPCLTVLEPVFSDGEFKGILRALTYLDTIQTNFLSPVRISRNGYAWAVDSNKIMIMHPNAELIGKPLEAIIGGTFTDRSAEHLRNILDQMVIGKDGVGTYQSEWLGAKSGSEARAITAFSTAHLGNQAWSIAVTMDYSEIHAPIAKQMRNAIFLSVLMALLFAGSGSIIYGKHKKESALQAEAEHLRMLSETAEALRMSEDKLARSKKMESLGLLAGGVAHDLNNVLSGIVSYPELLLLKLPEDSELRKPIETIKESGFRATAIVQDLLTVARGVAINKEPLNINAIINSYMESPEFNKLTKFHPTVSITSNLDAEFPNIHGSPIHIQKVIMNLVSNASEAINGEGNVRIATESRYIDREHAGYESLEEGEYLVLSVSDNGPGLMDTDVERMFEPFYTKKVMGRSGTGLGLAVVWNVVKDHNGFIDVLNNENGTTFEIYFPSTKAEVFETPNDLSIEKYLGQGETVLVVDDVDTQLEISGKMLATLGYNVETAASGEAAIEYVKEHSVDLIVLDMIMEPGMSGKEAYAQILKIHPDQKAVVVSGFAETDDVADALRLGAGKFIKKPFTINQIGLAVKEELEK